MASRSIGFGNIPAMGLDLCLIMCPASSRVMLALISTSMTENSISLRRHGNDWLDCPRRGPSRCRHRFFMADVESNIPRMINSQLLFFVAYLAFFAVCVGIFGAFGAVIAVVALIAFYAAIWNN